MIRHAVQTFNFILKSMEASLEITNSVYSSPGASVTTNRQVARAFLIERNVFAFYNEGSP